jgi:hypothetical protein
MKVNCTSKSCKYAVNGKCTKEEIFISNFDNNNVCHSHSDLESDK